MVGWTRIGPMQDAPPPGLGHAGPAGRPGTAAIPAVDHRQGIQFRLQPTQIPGGGQKLDADVRPARGGVGVRKGSQCRFPAFPRIGLLDGIGCLRGGYVTEARAGVGGAGRRGGAGSCQEAARRTPRTRRGDSPPGRR